MNTGEVKKEMGCNWFNLLGSFLICLSLVYGQQLKKIARDRLHTMPNVAKKTITTKRYTLKGDEIAKPKKFSSKNYVNSANRGPSQSFQTLGYAELQIGSTTYDLQTNSSSIERIFGDLSSNKWAATWTFSTNTQGSWPDRGTGYNFFNGSTWGNPPTVRLESVRTGWPNLVWTASGYEVVISHDPANNRLIMLRRQIGTGSWTETSMANITSIALWPRLAVGGPDGNTLHLIGLTVPSAFGGTPYQGMDGALLYCRSIDGGITWDIVDALLPNIDSNHYSGISGDSYSINARGNTVAIALGSLLNGLQVWKSTDNGLTWQFFEVLENFEYLYGNPSPQDTIYTGDESIEVIIDTNNIVHAFWGAMIITNYDSAQGTLSYFPLIDAIDYWNETMGNYTFAEGIASSNTDYLISTNQLTQVDQVGKYRLSGTSCHPTSAIDINTNCIYLLYSGLSTHNNGAQFYRHIMGVRSCDNGCTWTNFIDISNLSQDLVSENVFPSLFYKVDTALRFIFQRDYEPGMAVSGDQDPISSNDILFAILAKTAFDTITGCNIAPYFKYPSTLCSGANDTIWGYCSSNNFLWNNGSTASYLPINGPGTYEVTVSGSTCQDTVLTTITIPGSTSAPNVLLTGPQYLCPGDNGTLMVLNPQGGVTYIWSTGDTAPSTTINNPGTYYITATNCVGSKEDSIKVPTPPVPSVTITGPSLICPGDTILIAATSSQLNVTYTWSNGATTNTITVNAPGSYSVTVSNCSGSGADTLSIAYPSPITVGLLASKTTACEGTSIVINSNVQGGNPPFTYLWSNNATTPSITLNLPSHSGSYYLTVKDQCDSVGIGGPVNITIFPLPPQPTIGTFKNGNNCGFYVTPTNPSYSSYEWYVNGVAQGVNNDTLIKPCDQVSGKSISVSVTDVNGCVVGSSPVTGIYEYSYVNSEISINYYSLFQEIIIEGRIPIDQIIIKDLAGKVVKNMNNEKKENTIKISTWGLPQGIYTLTIKSSKAEREGIMHYKLLIY